MASVSVPGASSPDISYPGRDWRMRWVDSDYRNFQLDIVGFLAILGEDAVKKTSRLASLTWLFCLPRLLPAPHALLYVERPEQFDTVKCTVTGVQSGNTRDYLPHVAAALFGIQLPRLAVRCLRVTRNKELYKDENVNRIKAAYSGPVNLANFLGCMLSIALFTLSLIYGDGMSLIATILLSLLSTLAGLTNHWTLEFPIRRIGPTYGAVPPGDCVIRWPNGSFLVLKCDEDIARELIFAEDKVNYTMQNITSFIPISLLGTVALMLSVISLANAKIELQFAWAGAYILLNTGHWVAAALPRGYNFDFSNYEIEEEYLSTGPQSGTYTEALWKTIVFTKSVRWVTLSKAMPDTWAWREWLHEADAVIQTRTEEPRFVSDQGRTTSSMDLWITRLRKGRKEHRVHSVPDWDPRKVLSVLLARHENE